MSQLSTARLEAWILEIASRVLGRRPVEDSRVECKRDWPDASFRTARRLAAHANECGSATLLWVIGVDERHSLLKDVEQRELANWWPAIENHFDSPPPLLLKNLAVRLADRIIVGLLFESDRVPYLVALPGAERPSGTGITAEVPWREGNRVRSARHEDLIRVLVPRSSLPELAVLHAVVHVNVEGNEKARVQVWGIDLLLYAFLTSDAPVTFPEHDVELWFEVPGATPRFGARRFSFGTFGDRNSGAVSIAAGHSGVTIYQSGSFHLRAHVSTPVTAIPLESTLTLSTKFVPVGATSAISVEAVVPTSAVPTSAHPDENTHSWKWTRRPEPPAGTRADSAIEISPRSEPTFPPGD